MESTAQGAALHWVLAQSRPVVRALVGVVGVGVVLRPGGGNRRVPLPPPSSGEW